MFAIVIVFEGHDGVQAVVSAGQLQNHEDVFLVGLLGLCRQERSGAGQESRHARAASQERRRAQSQTEKVSPSRMHVMSPKLVFTTEAQRAQRRNSRSEAVSLLLFLCVLCSFVVNLE